MLENLATGDIFRIFTVLEQVSADIKIKVMRTSDAIYIGVLGMLFLIWVVELVKILIRKK